VKVNEEFKREFGRKLNFWRVEIRGWTRSDLAQHIGVSNSTIAMYESGKRMPNLMMLVILAEALDVDADDLLPEVDYSVPTLEGQTNIFDVIGE